MKRPMPTIVDREKIIALKPNKVFKSIRLTILLEHNEDWEQPTYEELRSLKEYLNGSGSQMGNIVGANA